MADMSTLKRNDVKGAMAVYEEAWKKSPDKVSGELIQMLYMLQDDTGALRDAMEAFYDAHHGKK